jgi:deoxyadenosine/deoxycytidine kinase
MSVTPQDPQDVTAMSDLCYDNISNICKKFEKSTNSIESTDNHKVEAEPFKRTFKIYEGVKVNPNVLSFLKGKTIEIVGFPGSGKSSIGKLLKKFLEEFSVPVFLAEEHIEKELFKNMLDDPKNYAFAYQYVMLKHRIELKEKIQRMLITNPNLCVIIDGGLITDLSFALYHVNKDTLNKEQWGIYRQKLNNNAHNLVVPDIIFEISCSYDNLQKKLEIRHRNEEIKTNGECVYDEVFYKNMTTIYDHIKKTEMYKDMSKRHVSFENDVIIDKNSIYTIESKNRLLKSILNMLNQHVSQRR